MTRPILTRVALLAAFAALVARVTTTAQAPPPAFANFEEAQTNPIRLSADGTRLFAVNTANDTLSVFDVTKPATPNLLAQIPVGLGPVSVNPLTDDEAWVINQVSNSVSIISVSKGIVTNTINDLNSEPMDVVFAGTNQAYVSVSRTNQVVVFDTTTLARIITIPLFGDNPRAMAVSPSGGTVYAAFALSGNGTTIIPPPSAPPQCGSSGAPACVPPFNPQLPPPPQVGLIVAATNPAWASVVTYKMPDNDVVAINTGTTPSIGRYYSGVGTINLGLGVNPVNGDLYVANTDALNLTFFEPNLQGHWVNNQITHIHVSTGEITPYNLNPNVDYGLLPNPQALTTALAQPTNVVFDPSGDVMYVASYGTDRVAQVSTNGTVLWFVEVGPAAEAGSGVDSANKVGPRGLALNAIAQTLYCLNRISDTISIINTASKTVTSQIAVGSDPEPSVIKNGRGFLYDAKLSGNGTGSCASCHVDGDMDKLAWNLGNPAGSMTSTVQNQQTIEFHPMKGPMTTQTLRGLLNLSPYHWRGDQPNFAAFNPTFTNLMGGPELSTANMTAFTNYASTILYLPNPNENLNRTLPASLGGANPVNGQNDFLTLAQTSSVATCNQCHTADPGPGSNRLIQVRNPQPMKDAQLRNIYQKLLFTSSKPATIDGFGLTHDGSTSTLLNFLAAQVFATYTATEKADIAAYLAAFDTGTAPAVGYTLTLRAATVGGSPAQLGWTTLQSQAVSGNIDLIARGTIAGQIHGLLYQPSTNNYISNAGVVYTQAQLQAFILAGDTLSFMGVYPGTGTT